MTGNRVDELESQVSELRAAVDGLTEELVETKERLRQLEAANDVEAVGSTPPAPGSDESTAASEESETAAEKDTPAGEQSGDDEAESESSDIIVA
jgi:peptidoglycan hydrolase CwlO-like protein